MKISKFIINFLTNFVFLFFVFINSVLKNTPLQYYLREPRGFAEYEERVENHCLIWKNTVVCSHYVFPYFLFYQYITVEQFLKPALPGDSFPSNIGNIVDTILTRTFYSHEIQYQHCIDRLFRVINICVVLVQYVSTAQSDVHKYKFIF